MLSVSIYTKAQHTLTHQANCPRPGDILLKQEIEYQDPGKFGKNMVWNFSKLVPVEKKKGLFSKSFDQIQPCEDITKYLQIITNSDVQFSYLTADSGRIVRGLENGFINSYNASGGLYSFGEATASSMCMMLPA